MWKTNNQNILPGLSQVCRDSSPPCPGSRWHAHCHWPVRLIRRRSRVWVGNIRGKLLIQQNCGLFSPVKVISFDLLTFHQITFHQNIALTRSSLCSGWSEALSSAFWLAHSVPPAPLIVKLNRNKVSRETGRFILIGSSRKISYIQNKRNIWFYLSSLFPTKAKSRPLEKLGGGSGWEMIVGGCPRGWYSWYIVVVFVKCQMTKWRSLGPVSDTILLSSWQDIKWQARAYISISLVMADFRKSGATIIRSYTNVGTGILESFIRWEYS